MYIFHQPLNICRYYSPVFIIFMFLFFLPLLSLPHTYASMNAHIHRPQNILLVYNSYLGTEVTKNSLPKFIESVFLTNKLNIFLVL